MFVSVCVFEIPSMQSAVFCVAFLACVAAAVDHFEVLGLSRDATTADVRRRYRELAISLHPDKAGDNPEAQA